MPVSWFVETVVVGDYIMHIDRKGEVGGCIKTTEAVEYESYYTPKEATKQ